MKNNHICSYELSLALKKAGFFFRNRWMAMVCCYGAIEPDAVFDTIEEAQRFLGIHDSQITQTEKVIWERR